jgi:hypothetical protein
LFVSGFLKQTNSVRLVTHPVGSREKGFMALEEMSTTKTVIHFHG